MRFGRTSAARDASVPAVSIIRYARKHTYCSELSDEPGITDTWTSMTFLTASICLVVPCGKQSIQSWLAHPSIQPVVSLFWNYAPHTATRIRVVAFPRGIR